jgi:hypothetical protein
MDITTLDKRLDKLAAPQRDLFRRLYRLETGAGRLAIPPEMREWAARQFGSAEAVVEQCVVRLTNLITGEETLFNPLRSRRPSDSYDRTRGIETMDKGADSFDDPLRQTSADTFGRIRGRFCVTASNIAKCDSLHGLVIFDEHHPLKWGQEQVLDYLETGYRWAEAAHRQYPAAKYYFFCWNCLWRSGASLYHGHAQMMLGQGRHYTRIEALRRAALAYRRRYGTSYFDDLYRVHEALGCARTVQGTRILACLTPVKSREIMIMASDFGLSFQKRVFEALACYRDQMGVVSFNLGLTTRPLDRTRESWQGFPAVAWMVDRGPLSHLSSDIGALELFASTFAGDPFPLAAALDRYYTTKGVSDD